MTCLLLHSGREDSGPTSPVRRPPPTVEEEVRVE